MADVKKFKIRILKGTKMDVSFNKDMLLNIQETYDGMSFQFGDGNYFYITDPNMTNETKIRISQSLNALMNANADILVNFNDLKTPVSLSVI